MTDLNQLAADLNEKDYIASAKVWQDRRIYVTFASTDRGFRGDRNAKTYYEAGEWHIDHGKGTNSPGYNEAFNNFYDAHIAA